MKPLSAPNILVKNKVAGYHDFAGRYTKLSRTLFI